MLFSLIFCIVFPPVSYWHVCSAVSIRYWWVWRKSRHLWRRPVHQHSRGIPLSVLRRLHGLYGHEDVYRWEQTQYLEHECNINSFFSSSELIYGTSSEGQNIHILSASVHPCLPRCERVWLEPKHLSPRRLREHQRLFHLPLSAGILCQEGIYWLHGYTHSLSYTHTNTHTHTHTLSHTHTHLGLRGLGLCVQLSDECWDSSPMHKLVKGPQFKNIDQLIIDWTTNRTKNCLLNKKKIHLKVFAWHYYTEAFYTEN